MDDCAGCGSCVPWSPDMSCCDNWGDIDDNVLCKSIDLAWDTLRVLSGGMVGNCPVLVRPCLSSPCNACSSSGPRLMQTGDCATCWVNSACGQSGCSCSRLDEIVLPGLVAEVWQIKVDGILLPVDTYRVDNGNRIVRVDGQPWPSCQHMSRGTDVEGTLAVWYVPGIVPDSTALWAAGVMTCEFSKACSGAKCRLPSSVTSIARQGITMEMSTGMFPDGLTGIREVDAFLTSVNPNALRIPPKVWSPDLATAKHRYTTSQYGSGTPTPVPESS